MTRRKTKPSPMVRVGWIDASMEVSPHWIDGTQPRRPKARDHVCVSVGWLTHLDEHFAQVVQTLSDGQHANVVNIPRGMVRSIELLAASGPMDA